jgi:hypothetical protein
MAMTITAAVAVLLPVAMNAGQQGAARPAPIAVVPFRGQYCGSVGPRGWFVRAENAQRVAFGADFTSGDGKVSAGYSIFAAGSLNTVPGFENPDRAVAANLTGMGSIPTRFGNKQQIGPNVYLISYQTASYEGMAFYQVIATGRGGYMVVMRTAVTAPGQWKWRGAEASAVARSLRCQAPNVPAAPDPPALNAKKKKTADDGESDSLYNQWLDKEYYHNPQTGENFWVSPSQDWVKDGPEGEGYYAQHGNSMIKLESGYSQ